LKPQQLKIDSYIKENKGTVLVRCSGAQSRDAILKARFEEDDAEAIKAFCRGRRITVTDYLSNFSRLDVRYFDLIDTLNAHADTLLPVIEAFANNVTKKF